jgi:hypothetical protein
MARFVSGEIGSHFLNWWGAPRLLAGGFCAFAKATAIMPTPSENKKV